MSIRPISAPNPFSIYTSQVGKTSQVEKNSSSSGKIDVVTLSDEGKKMQAQNSINTSSIIDSFDDFMDGAGKDGVITLDEIRAFGEKNLKEAEDILAKTLEQLSIPSGHSITISTDREGKVVVDSDLSAHDNDRLETALNEHPDFQQTFARASTSQSFLDAAEKYEEFAQAYAQNPKAAVAQYGIGSSSLSSGEYVLQYAQGQTSLVLQDSFSLMG